MADDFTKLKVWIKATDLTIEVYQLTHIFPAVEKYGISQQIRNSSNSVAANIAESSGRYFKKDKIRVLYIARGELEETRSHLEVSRQLCYCTNEIASDLDNRYIELRKMLNSYIKFLSSH